MVQECSRYENGELMKTEMDHGDSFAYLKWITFLKTCFQVREFSWSNLQTPGFLLFVPSKIWFYHVLCDFTSLKWGFIWHISYIYVRIQCSIPQNPLVQCRGHKRRRCRFQLTSSTTHEASAVLKLTQQVVEASECAKVCTWSCGWMEASAKGAWIDWSKDKWASALSLSGHGAKHTYILQASTQMKKYSLGQVGVWYWRGSYLHWFVDWLIDWLIDSLTHWLNLSWLINWLIDCLIHWLLHWLLALLIDSLIASVIDLLVAHWFIDWLIPWLLASLFYWLIPSFTTLCFCSGKRLSYKTYRYPKAQGRFWKLPP